MLTLLQGSSSLCKIPVFTGSKRPGAATVAYSPLSAAVSDVLEIRFGRAPDANERAQVFSQEQGARLHQLMVNSSREQWHVLRQRPGASYTRLKELERNRLEARLNTTAYTALTDLLRPDNLAQIKAPGLGSHLQLLMDRRLIRPDSLRNRSIVELEVEIRTLELQLDERMGQNQLLGQTPGPNTHDELAANENKLKKALRHQRNQLAKMHGQTNFYDFQLAKQGLHFEDLKQFYEEAESLRAKFRAAENAMYLRQDVLTFPMIHTPKVLALYEAQGINPAEQDLGKILEGQNIKTPQDLLLAAARIIGQTPTVEKILRNSQSKDVPKFPAGSGLVVPIEAPDEIGLITRFPSTLRQLRDSTVVVHETLGHALSYSLLKSSLPPQFRDGIALDDYPFPASWTKEWDAYGKAWSIRRNFGWPWAFRRNR
jgi:hypothetical protein